MSDTPTVVGGRYVLVGPLGRGGMAEVHRAVDQRLDREVAVKRLSAHLAADPTAQTRFGREARAAASLNHPAIAAVFDTGQDTDPADGTTSLPYIVMELVEGSTLRKLLNDGVPLSPERALAIVQSVLEALAHAHAAGIVHRDIKPANVMLTEDGSVKVMDFGIARALGDTTTSLTEAAAVIGTAQYFSPEQASGKPVDQRSDLYSVGCLLFELLTGRPPFVGESSISVAYQHVREVPATPSELNPALGPAVDALVLKALAKDPDLRYQSAQEMSADLVPLLADPAADDATRAVPAVGRTAPLVPAPPAPASFVPAPLVPAPPVPDPFAPDPLAPDPFDEDGTRVVPATGARRALTDEPEGRRHGRRTALIVTSLLLVLAIAAFAWYQILGSGQPAASAVTVPAVLNSSRAEADAALRAADLVPRFEQVHGKRDDTLNTVTGQVPPGGSKVAAGAVITVQINVGPATTEIPDKLVGATLAAAKKRLAAAGFTTVRAEPVTDPSGRTKRGRVASVAPDEGAAVSLDEEIVLGYVPENAVTEATTRPTADATSTKPKPKPPASTTPSQPTQTAESTQAPSPSETETTEAGPSATPSPVETSKPSSTPAPTQSG